MGNICPCFKSQDQTHQYTAISTRGHSQSAELAPAVNKSQYYQAVVDIAQKKFINSSGVKACPISEDSEELRAKVCGAQMGSNDTRRSRGSHGGSSTSAQQVIDTLSEPVNKAIYNYDIVADEMAEMIAKHTTLNVDDSMNATVASFKPVNLQNV